MKLNIDNVDVKMVDPITPPSFEDTEDAKRRKRRRAPRRRRPKQKSAAVFAKSRVHIFIGGTPSDAKFVGCIGNIRIDNDPWHPGLLTDGARCGLFGSARCSGKPRFNSCTARSLDRHITAKFPTERFLESPITRLRAEEGEISAQAFTNGETFNGHNHTDLNGDAERTPKRKRGRKRGKNRQRGNRNQDTIVQIEAVQHMYTGYDENCQLPMTPETSGFYYPGDGYSKYSVAGFNSMNWRFSMKIRTAAKEGIIFFMCTAGCPEHIAVYLVKGKVVLGVKFLTERRRIKTDQRYNDNMWHDILFQRKGHNLQMIVDNTIINSDFFENSYTFSSLMLFYVGGLQPVEKSDALSFMSRDHLADFKGCIQDLAVNDESVETSSSSRLLFKIKLRPCFEGETEPGIFFSNSVSGDDDAYMLAHNTYNVGMDFDVTMEIRPRVQSGILLAAGGYTGDFVQLALIDGKVVARVKQSTDTLMSVYDPAEYRHRLCDGNWHKVKVIKSKNILALSVDGNQVFPIEQGDENIRVCETDGPLYIGGLPDHARVGKLLTSRRQYTGCMRKIRLDYASVTPDIAIEVKSGVSMNSCPLY